MCYLVLSWFWKALFIILCACTPSVFANINITVRLFDANGRESPLVYDGGKAEITCRYQGCKGNHSLRSRFSTKGSPVTLVASVKKTILKHIISINSTTLSLDYECSCGNRDKGSISFTYVLCNHRSVTPRKVCEKPKQFCNINKTGSAECKNIFSYACSYKPAVDGTSTSIGHHVPNFKPVCTEYWHRTLIHTGDQCYSLLDLHNPLVTSPAKSKQVCSQTFNVYTCRKDCKFVKRLINFGWDFIDVVSPFSIYVLLSARQNYDVVCSATNGKDSLINSSKIKPIRDKVTKIVGFVEQLRKLSTPTIADIVCVVSNNGSAVLQFQTYLLLFKSDTDLKYEITDENAGVVGERVFYKVIIKVTAAEGFYMCVKARKGICRRKVANRTVLERIVSYKQDGDNYTITFYIGIFASSPKDRYVLVHEELIRHKVRPSVANPPTTAGILKRHKWIKWLIVALGIACAVGVALILVAVFIRLRKKKRALNSDNRGRRSEPQIQKVQAKGDPGQAATFRRVSKLAAAKRVEENTIQSKMKSLESRTKSYSLKLSKLLGIQSTSSAKPKH